MFAKIENRTNLSSQVNTIEGHKNNGILNFVDNRPQSIVQKKIVNIIQQKKTEEQRGGKSQRLAYAKDLIPQYATKFNTSLATHIFEGEFRDSSPKGLHAYKNGNLSDKASNVKVTGNKNKVHKIEWTYKDKGTASKNSTMFPAWMPVGHVKTLIGIEYPGYVKSFKPDHTTSLKTYILHGLNIKIEKAGDTVYPIL